jgi:serine/threonine-protein kinase
MESVEGREPPMCRIEPESVQAHVLAVLRGHVGLPALAAYDLLHRKGACLAHFCEAVRALARRGSVRSSDPAQPISPDLAPARLLELGLEAPVVPPAESSGDRERLLPHGFRVFLDQPLGRGSFGLVYLGEQVRLRRPVAVKLLHLPSLPSDVPRAWFIARLHHPHIVQVIDCGEQDEELWYAMEYLPGGTLGDRIRSGGALPPDEVRACFLALAGALHEAARHGILHRDVKPGNVFNAGPKLADFGLAKLPAAPAGEDRPGVVTPTAAVVGTPPYIAPERASYGSGDVRSDVYSLGATMYHAATGRTLFDHDPADRARWYASHLHEEPRPVLDRAPGFPKALAAVIHRCLAKDPADRYPGFEAVAEALRR